MSAGRFALSCGLGVLVVSAARLEAQDTTRARPPQKLETVRIEDSAEVISPRLAGFERRRSLKAGSTTFTMGEDIVKRATIRLSDALRRAHGVMIVDSLDVRLVASSRFAKPKGGGFAVGDRRPGLNNPSSRGAILAPCVMRIAVDGQLKEWGFSVDDVPVTDVYGIEVYPGAATIPPEFATIKQDGWCGMVMIWTRSR
jgi:hypothetical protein